MKKVLLFCVLGLMFSLSSLSVSARATIIYGNGPEFQELTVLPDSVKMDGHHVNYGIAFEQFALFYIPIWNYGEPEFAVYADGNSTIYSLEHEDLEYLQQEYGVAIDEASLKLSFWNRFGGKLVVLGVLVIALLGYLWTRRGDEEGVATEGIPSDGE